MHVHHFQTILSAFLIRIGLKINHFIIILFKFITQKSEKFQAEDATPRSYTEKTKYYLALIFMKKHGLCFALLCTKSQNLMKVLKLRQNMQKFVSSSRV